MGQKAQPVQSPEAGVPGTAESSVVRQSVMGVRCGVGNEGPKQIHLSSHWSTQKFTLRAVGTS